MGYIVHHAIIVTTWKDEAAEPARAKAAELGMAVTDIIGGAINGYSTFLVGPDGSKDGWQESDEGDSRREEFVSWIESQAYDDGSSCYDWAEVQYGDDDQDNRVLRSDADLWLARQAVSHDNRR